MNADSATILDAGADPIRQETLIVDLEGFEGPLDVLLTLARAQKVDLTRISILALTEQYLAFVTAAQKLNLDLAADYLVMAAWLAYLKSRLLLPEPDRIKEEPSPEELAERLSWQLTRLEAIRKASGQLMALPQLGREVFGRGAPEGVRIASGTVYEATLYDLLKAYGAQRMQKAPVRMRVAKAPVYAIEDARRRLERMMGLLADWNTLESIIGVAFFEPAMRRSAAASTLAACLDMARDGLVELQQSAAFGPVSIRPKGVKATMHVQEDLKT